MSISNPIARAIDVGFGRVKFSLSDTSFMHFPSLAIPSSPQVDLPGARPRNTFDVPAGEMSFEVGAEVALAQSGHEYGRAISDQFYKTPVYEALAKGALSYMHAGGDREIDVLVLGLPVDQYFDPSRREFLTNKYQGTLDLGAGRSVRIKKVAVQAQPMGGYIELYRHLKLLNEHLAREKSSLKRVERLEDHNVLIVDPGEHTLDWLLMRQGSLARTASGAANAAGRHRIITTVQELLQAKIGRSLAPSSQARINEALRMGQPLRIAGVEYNLREFDSAIKAVVADPVSRMMDHLQGNSDLVDLIAVVGGDPERYRDALQERFPGIPVYIIEPAVEANVRGFQSIAVGLAGPAASE